MSWNVCLEKDGEEVVVPEFSEGGTYCIGGTDRATLNVTWNYNWFYKQFLDKTDTLNWLHGKVAGETIGRLAGAVGILGTERWDNYWAPTPGNAGHALNILLGWATLHPDAIWFVN